MKSLWKPLKSCLLALMIGLAALSCARNQTDRSRMDRAIEKMNNRQYSDAASMLEELYQENPKDSATALLLAQAHLGEADFEMMELIQKISGAQAPVDPNEFWVDQPECTSGPIKKVSGFDIRCLLFRLVHHLPDAEHPGVLRAKEILRTAFSDPKQAPSDVNFLAALVELSSALYRIRELGKSEAKTLLEQEPQDSASAQKQFKFVVYNVKRLLIETHQGLRRLRYSYGKLASIVKQMDGKPMITIGDHSLIFNDSLDTPQILEFASLIVRDNFHSLDNEADRFAGNEIRMLGFRYTHTLAKFDKAFMNREHVAGLQINWRADEFIAQFLEGVAAHFNEDTKVKPANLLWQHPPIILEGFKKAAAESWDKESIFPVWDYFVATKSRWNELGSIMDAWGNWFDSYLSDEQRLQVKGYLHDQLKSDPRFKNLPERVRVESAEKYGKELSEASLHIFAQVLHGKVPGLAPFSDDQKNQGLWLTIQTYDWINTNLWGIDPQLLNELSSQ